MPTIHDLNISPKALKRMEVDGPGDVWMNLVNSVRAHFNGCTVSDLALKALDILFPNKSLEWRKNRAKRTARAFHDTVRSFQKGRTRSPYVPKFLRQIAAYIDTLMSRPRKRHSCATA